MQKIITIILALLLFIYPVYQLSTPVQITPTTKYSYSGTQIFSTTPYYGTANSVVNWLTYIINFPQAMNDTNYKSAIAIQQIYAEIPNKAFNLTFMLNTKNTADLQYDMWSDTMNKIQSITFRYLIISSVWGNFGFYWFTDPVYSTISSSSSYSIIQTGLDPVNMTGTVKSFACLTGFDVTAISTATELSLILTVAQSTSTSAVGSLSSLSSLPISVKYISYNLLVYNVGQIVGIPGKITQGVFSASNSGILKYADTSQIVRNYNILFGLQGFHIKNENFLSWNGILTVNTSIDVSSSNNFLYFKFIYIIFQSNWCPQNTPYQLIATLTCYDTCPIGYYPNNVGVTCQSCLYDCYTCTNATKCQTCNSTTDLRQINNSTGRCKAILGYYDDGLNHQIALPCNSNCMGCANTSTKCTSCYPGKYLSGISCLACADSNCINCTSISNCFNCTLPYSLSGSTCVFNCSLAIANCTICNMSPVSCAICVTGFYLNTTDDTCKIICGDGILASTQQCDDGNPSNNDGCSSTCTIQPAYFCTGAVGSLSTCIICSLNCLNCTSAITCSLCDTHYRFNTTTQLCQVNCSQVTNCITCTLMSNLVNCSSCVSGYVVDNSNTCVTKCGDGILMGSQQCDDNNTVDGDGCSSLCVIQTAYFCQGSPKSSCYPCVAHCSSCANNNSCTTCQTLAPWNTTSLSCNPNCPSINGCSTCSVINPFTASNFIQCTNCTTGYNVDIPNNLCIAICGDGLVLGGQACDDGNLIDGDGCSSTCTVQQAYYCSSSPSICNACLAYCLACNNGILCNNCNSLSSWNSTINQCQAVCTSINYCTSCQVATSLATYYVQCLFCSGGYSVNSSNLCQPICGDGRVAPEQNCDDGNLANGDGCDSKCKIEQYYSCNITVSNTSQCFLIGLTLNLVQTTKSPTSNSGTMSFYLNPSSLAIFNNVNWTSIISVPNNQVNISSAYYDPITNRVIVSYHYNKTIEATQFVFKIDPSNVPQLSPISQFNLQVLAHSDDNQSLQFYSQSEYKMADIVKYTALGLGACAVLFLIFGILGGRLIGLQCSAVIQLSSISTLTLQNLSPTFNALESLAWSLGYNKLKSYNYSESIDKALKSTQFSRLYIQNYNLMGVIIFLPVIAAIVCKIIEKLKKQPQKQQYWSTKAKHCIGEFTLYALLSFSYLSFVAFSIQFKYLQSKTMDYIGLTVGIIVVLLVLFYMVFYAKAQTYYTQFKQKFNSDGFSSRFYIFYILERLIVSACLVQFMGKNYGNATVIAIQIVLAVCLLIKQPYLGDKKNYRPFANLMIVIVIQGIYLGVNFMNNSKGFLSLYGPLVVVGLLLICLLYSAYALIKEIKQNLENCSKDKSFDNLPKNQLQIRQFTAKLMNQQSKSIFQQENILQNRSIESSMIKNETITKRLSLSNIKSQLLSLKKNQNNNNLLESSLQQANIHSIFQAMDGQI